MAFHGCLSLTCTKKLGLEWTWRTLSKSGLVPCVPCDPVMGLPSLLGHAPRRKWRREKERRKQMPRRPGRQELKKPNSEEVSVTALDSLRTLSLSCLPAMMIIRACLGHHHQVESSVLRNSCPPEQQCLWTTVAGIVGGQDFPTAWVRSGPLADRSAWMHGAIQRTTRRSGSGVRCNPASCRPDWKGECGRQQKESSASQEQRSKGAASRDRAWWNGGSRGGRGIDAHDQDLIKSLGVPPQSFQVGTLPTC